MQPRLGTGFVPMANLPDSEDEEALTFLPVCVDVGVFG